jgi:hypothetical protein
VVQAYNASKTQTASSNVVEEEGKEEEDLRIEAEGVDARPIF